MTRPIPSCFTIRNSRSSTRNVGSSIQWISPIVSAIAVGSLRPVSPSSVRASLRRMWVKRIVAKTAAASVEATTPPSRIASGQARSKSSWAARPVRNAVTATPIVLRSAAGIATLRIRRHEVESPPS